MSYIVVPDNNPGGPIYYAFYNEYTGAAFYADVNAPYVLQDGDLVMTTDSYYMNDVDAPDRTMNPPVPAPGPFSIVETTSNDDVMNYSPDPAGANAGTGNPDADCSNYPSGNDADDPGYVDVDPGTVDDYEQYYDDNNDPTYTASDCDSSVGIRG